MSDELTPAEARRGLRGAVRRRDTARRQLEQADADVARWAERSKGVLRQAELEQETGLSRMQLWRLVAWAHGEKPSRH